MDSVMEEFLEILAGMDKADGTVKLYRKGLEQYSDWLDQQDISPEDATPRDIQRYLAHLKNDCEFAPKTVRIRFTAITRFYQDLTNNGIDADDPTDPIRIADYAPETTRREEITKEKHVWLTKDEVKQLVENVPNPSLRNRLVVLFQYYTALRRQEVVDVKIEDLNREERMVKVRGKGGTNNTAYWQPKLDSLLDAWLDGGYRDSLTPSVKSPYLFITRNTEKMSPGRVNSIVVEAAKNAGIQEVLYTDANGRKRYKYTSHVLRHSFAMHYLQNGGSIEGLSKLMAHSSVTTTEIYGEILDQRASEEYEQFAPDIEFSV